MGKILFGEGVFVAVKNVLERELSGGGNSCRGWEGQGKGENLCPEKV